tara:strand:+ start:280 stop:405 length:126 start_codon:yes stop_codon:yes gene_type:complete
LTKFRNGKEVADGVCKVIMPIFYPEGGESESGGGIAKEEEK